MWCRLKPGKLVSARITPLRLEAFEQLPKHARQCVFWEVDPRRVGLDDHLADPEFEKEAWLSMVMLEWGSCGQMAITVPAVPRGATDDDQRGDRRRGTPAWGMCSTRRRTPCPAPCGSPPAR